MINDLVQFGLNQEEAKTYIAILELGGSYASNIAKKAKINRATCYHTLNKLKEKGLINSYTKNKILWFNAEDPQTFTKIAQEKLKYAKDLIPQLLSISNTITFKPKIRFYEGKSGVKEIFTDILKTKSELLGYTNIKSLAQLFGDYFTEYCGQKINSGIKTRNISPETAEGTDIIDQYYPKNYDRNLLEVLLVNSKEFYFENDISIYENKVAIISLNPNETMGLIIESPTFAKSMRSIFNLAWLGATAFVAK